MITTITVLLYAIGYFLSYSMLRIEHESEKLLYTHGDRLKSISLSLASFLTVVIILVITWIKSIERTGYWSRPIKPAPPNTPKKEDAA